MQLLQPLMRKMKKKEVFHLEKEQQEFFHNSVTLHHPSLSKQVRLNMDASGTQGELQLQTDHK